MSPSFPEYLRLHQEETHDDLQFNLDGHQIICRSLEKITGWEFLLQETRASIQRRGDSVSGDVAFGNFEIVDLSAELGPQQRPLHREKAETLAGELNKVVNQLNLAHQSIRNLQAELATAIPVVVDPSDHQQTADLLNQLLNSAAKIAGCNRAALYMLNDSTSNLEIRAAVGMDESIMRTEPRHLERCVADIEAIVGHAVVIEDVSLLPHWKVPVQCKSAICIPVSSMTTPLGTLWIFGDDVRDYTPQQTNMIEIIAGRIAAELQFVAMTREIKSKPKSSQPNRPAIRQTCERRQPVMCPPLDELTISLIEGSTENGVVDWSFDEDGKLVLFAATVDACDTDISIAQSMQTAFCALRNRVANPAELVMAIAETVGRLEPHEVFGSIACAFVDCDSMSIESSTIDSGRRQFALDAIEKADLQRCSLLETESVELSVAERNCGWTIERR